MDRQKQILEVFEGDFDKVLKKSEIIKKGKISYYINTKKWVGETLTRMVRNGSLIRVSHGLYKLNRHRIPKKDEVPENQIELFDNFT